MPEPVSTLEVVAVEEFDDINREQGWDIEYRQLQRGGFRGRMHALEASGALVSYEELAGPLDVQFDEPEDSVALLLPACPTGQFRLNGYLANDRRAFLLSSGADIRCLMSAATSCHVLRLPWGQFERIAVAQGPVRPLKRAETRAIDLGSVELELIRNAIDEILSIDQQDLGTAESRIACLVESVALLTQKKDGGLAKNHSDPNTFQRALEFIEANFKSDFSLADLCGAAHSHSRNLERLFKKEFGISPFQYVQARRLNSARRKLLDSDPNEVSVSNVAQDHGFAHLSRFAGRYREFFSELPSETLNRRR